MDEGLGGWTHLSLVLIHQLADATSSASRRRGGSLQADEAPAVPHTFGNGAHLGADR